jgi:hypothetical protein
MMNTENARYSHPSKGRVPPFAGAPVLNAPAAWATEDYARPPLLAVLPFANHGAIADSPARG